MDRDGPIVSVLIARIRRYCYSVHFGEQDAQ